MAHRDGGFRPARLTTDRNGSVVLTWKIPTLGLPVSSWSAESRSEEPLKYCDREGIDYGRVKDLHKVSRD